MRTAVHGMPRIGEGRALKWALESFWSGRCSADALELEAGAIRRRNWEKLAAAGIDFVPSNDFSLYDHVLDAVVAIGAVPERFRPDDRHLDLAAYFAMARGGDLGTGPLPALQLTKWFDTNYHHLVAEIGPDTVFVADAAKPCAELAEAAALGIATVPVLLGPLTLLLRSAPTLPGFAVTEKLDPLVDAYADLLNELHRQGATWVRLDEPALVEDRTSSELEMLQGVYDRLGRLSVRPSIVLSTYFGHVGDAMAVLQSLPVEGVGLDFCSGPANLDLLRRFGGVADKVLFAGVVDGRNVWVNDFTASLALLEELRGLSAEVVISTSCSLLHVPLSLAEERSLTSEIRPWLAVADDKLTELSVLSHGSDDPRSVKAELEANRAALEGRRRSALVTDPQVRRALHDAPLDPRRSADAAARAEHQAKHLALPLLPSTTIGSFPQTTELRRARTAWRTGGMTDDEYQYQLRTEVDRALVLQEEAGIDVLVHGEPERDDMVRYFAARLSGFVLLEEGWVQSYGSRCVRPPVLYGDVRRPEPMTLEWTDYARSRTAKPVKGIISGPVTMLRWSFVRDDRPAAEIAAQLGLAMRDELVDLQAAGTAVIQVDEPALREGFPLRRSEQSAYRAWATRAFRLVTSAAAPSTQVHTHMCYSQLGDILGLLGDLDVDVVSLEAARSKMQLIAPLASSSNSYRGGIGAGVFDVHSAIVPKESDMRVLLRRAVEVLGADRVWVNPDCGLKTRTYAEVLPALNQMANAARTVRAEIEARASGVDTKTTRIGRETK